MSVSVVNGYGKDVTVRTGPRSSVPFAIGETKVLTNEQWAYVDAAYRGTGKLVGTLVTTATEGSLVYIDADGDPYFPG